MNNSARRENCHGGVYTLANLGPETEQSKLTKKIA
jgi:hypothetical protein